MNISQLLAHQASKNPDHEAIVTDYERLTYDDWNRNVNQLADSLRKKGITQGDKIILHMPNTKEFLFTYFAIHRLGAIIVPINAKLVQREVMYIIQQSDAKVFITHESIFSQVQDVPKEADLLFIKTGEAQGDWHSFETLLTNGSRSEEHTSELQSRGHL